MKTVSNIFVAIVAAFASITAVAADMSSLAGISQTAETMMSELGVSGMSVDVIALRDVSSSPSVKAKLGSSQVAFEPGSPATSVYFRGVCTIIVDTKTVRQDITPALRSKMSKDELMFFITAHETGHCISHFRQEQELKALASGMRLSDTFLPKEIIAAGDAGTLNQATFNKILGSKAVAQREESFADALAALYVRTKQANAESILAGIVQTRATGLENGDDVHNTVATLQAVLSYQESLAQTEMVRVGYQLGM